VARKVSFNKQRISRGGCFRSGFALSRLGRILLNYYVCYPSNSKFSNEHMRFGGILQTSYDNSLGLTSGDITNNVTARFSRLATLWQIM